MRKLSTFALAVALLSGPALLMNRATAQTIVDSADARKAYRFLTQASFGARPADVLHLTADLKMNYGAWISEQQKSATGFSTVSAARKMPCSISTSQKMSIAEKKAVTMICPSDVSEAFWLGAVGDHSQLRQRMAFALSQIFVISVEDGSIQAWGDASAIYADLVYRDAFANFRVLLDDVSHSDAMGKFLSFLYNTKGAPASGSTSGTVPDQNFAREVMQLFTIGLVQLDLSGQPVLDPNTGRPLPTYSQDDIVGASNVMTGFGPHDDAKFIASDFKYNSSLWGREDYQFLPTVSYPQYHSTIAKNFLGVTIAASSTPNPDAELKVFLDTLFNHPNVGPFISKQLIQRLVTSNPSADYVKRVARVFDDNGSGVRGDLAAVARAILLDPEARADANVTAPTFGKLREPILRMAQLLRLLGGKPGADGTFGFQPYDATSQLGQYPYRSASVFNFYYPNYTPPLTALSANQLVAPEMQITTTETVYQLDGYLAPIFMKAGWYVGGTSAHYAFTLDYGPWLPLIAKGQIVEQLNLAFMSGQMSPTLQNDIQAEIAATKGGAQPQLARALRILFDAPEYIVQK